MCDGHRGAGLSRRAMLQAMTVAGAGLALAPRRGMASAAVDGLPEGAALAEAARREWGMPTDLTPDAALQALYQGNRRFVTGNIMAPHRNMARLKEVAPKQAPFAAFLGCADSRVPIEIVFDQGFGDLFVTRIAGNVATPEDIGSLEFGTLVLGAKVLYVLGHSACGAVTATMQGAEVPGQISTLYRLIRPAVKLAKGDIDVAIRENVRIQAESIAESSPVIAKLIREGKLKVAGGVYDLNTGTVTPVEMGA